jgi:hypothetical protein
MTAQLDRYECCGHAVHAVRGELNAVIADTAHATAATEKSA